MDQPGCGPAEGLPPHLRAAGRALRLEVGAGEIIQMLRSSGVDSLLLKGPTITKWLYDGQVSLRPPGDVDLLVDSREVALVEEVLSSAGYRHEPFDDIPGDKPWHAHSWRHPVSGIEIDLHRTLIGVGVKPTVLWEVLQEQTEWFELRGLEVRILDEAARSLHVALHAAQGGPADSRAVEDLRRAVALGNQVWIRARRIAEQLNALEALSAGLQLIPDGRKLVEGLRLPTKLPVHIALRSSSAPPEAIGLAWLIEMPGLRSKIALIARKTFPPKAFMDVWYPIERRGVLGIVGAYAFRIRWLARNLPRAARAWWLVRRANRAR